MFYVCLDYPVVNTFWYGFIDVQFHSNTAIDRTAPHVLDSVAFEDSGVSNKGENVVDLAVHFEIVEV